MTEQERREEITRRIADYTLQDATAQKRRLVELWRLHHPEAAQETSTHLKPLMIIHKRTAPQPKGPTHFPDEEWANDTYHVTLRRWNHDPVFATDGGMIQLGIASIDGSARHDWRDFQAIKNQLAGGECEAFELYPAESRLLDPSNYYTLWCFPGVKRLKIGHASRDVRDVEDSLAPQRAFPLNRERGL